MYNQEFLRELSLLLSKHKVAIVAEKDNIGFLDLKRREAAYTKRHHVTAYDVRVMRDKLEAL